MKGLSQHINESLEEVNESKALSTKVVKGKIVSVSRNPEYAKAQAKIIKIDSKLKSLNSERERIFSEMENDPEIEAEGGKIADAYGKRINKLDSEISNLENELRSLYDVKPTIEKVERDATRFEILYAQRTQK